MPHAVTFMASLRILPYRKIQTLLALNVGHDLATCTFDHQEDLQWPYKHMNSTQVIALCLECRPLR